jgi:hypothetical protein
MSDRHAYGTRVHDFDGDPAHRPSWQMVNVAIGYIRGLDRRDKGTASVLEGLRQTAEHLRTHRCPTIARVGRGHGG